MALQLGGGVKLKVYDASDTRRRRSTQAEMVAFRDAVYQLVKTNRPCSDRNTYYRAISAHLIEKDVGGKRNSYQRIIRAISFLRESGIMPFSWITDDTRLRRGPRLFDSAEDALKDMQRLYRRNLWRRQEYHVEVWVESDSAASEIVDTTWDLGIHLMSCRGQSSKTLAWTSVQEWMSMGKKIAVLYLGDWDPTGVAIPKSLLERFERYGSDLDIELERLAVTPEQIATMRLIGHDANRRDNNYRAFAEECRRHGLDPGQSVEVEAIDAPYLRALVRDAIEEYIDPRTWEIEEEIQQQEREALASLVEGFRTR